MLFTISPDLESVKERVGFMLGVIGNKHGWAMGHTKVSNRVCHIQSDLYYPWFLRPKFSTPNLYEVQSNL